MTCWFCKVHAAILRDADTLLVWCLGCARDLFHVGDPVVCFTEFDGDSYALELAQRGYTRRTLPDRDPPHPL
ncbi:hypothetical protein [Streptacidiphilus sp. MAP12-20]|uniref:hypothetical protein n=1 Tax=Streptacidiphilus sp. MAP12-20 TaxID=3156299 RepID=UPI0035137E7D